MPTPTPSAVSPASFAELQHMADNLVLAFQALGAGLLAVSIAYIAISYWMSFGNEHRHASTRAAAVSFLVGVALLAYAPTIAGIVRRIFPL
jgi:uncharacterized RDD family membrane protein YckC